MILTGPEIRAAHAAGDISIEPFDPAKIGPNGYDYHLGDSLIRIDSDAGGRLSSASHEIPKQGLLLEPGCLYLGSTHERIGSHVYAMTLLGRSSVGRLGIFLNVTADLGHVGSDSHWTLELSVVQPVYVYAGMCIGQVAFWEVEGARAIYDGRYKGDVRPEQSKDPWLRGRRFVKETSSDPVG
jgi:dCTP deaminase